MKDREAQMFPVSERSEVTLRMMSWLVADKKVTAKMLSDMFSKLYNALPEALDEVSCGDDEEGCTCGACLAEEAAKSIIEVCSGEHREDGPKEWVTMQVSFPKDIYNDLQKLVMVTKSGNVCAIRPGDRPGTWKWDGGNL